MKIIDSILEIMSSDQPRYILMRCGLVISIVLILVIRTQL